MEDLKTEVASDLIIPIEDDKMLFFSDKNAVLALINTICDSNFCDQWQQKFESFNIILSKYQEQPILLNSALSDLVTPLSFSLIEVAEKCIASTVQLFILIIVLQLQ